MICYARLKNRDKFLEWLKLCGWKRKANFHSSIYDGGWYNDNWQSYFYKKQDIFRGQELTNIFERDSIETLEDNTCTNKFFGLIDYLNEINQKMCVYYRDEFACIVGYGKQRYIMPAAQLDFIDLIDYKTLTQSELRRLGGVIGENNLPANINEKSQETLNNELNKQKELLDQISQEKKDIQAGAVADLKDLKAEMERIKQELESKQQELLTELQIRQHELDIKMKELEKEIFLLETQIYGIRCYLGEVVNFYKIQDGCKAPIDEPIVLYQKIRYLDEELGKAASIYDFEGTDREKDTFLQLIKNREDIRDLFVPNLRCISVLRVSRCGYYTAASDKVANALDFYETYHGRQLAIMLRNGDEIHITWLDEDKIELSDENVFYSPKKEASVMQYEDGLNVRPSSKEEIATRYFLLSILQGIADSGKLLEFPESISFIKPSQKYIIFSMADGWITNQKYGTFKDILGRVKKIPMKEGDMLLTGLSISRDDRYSTINGHRERDESFNNDRGIGERNRTHDASIPAFEIIPVNKVLFDLTIQYEYEKVKAVKTYKKYNYWDGSGTYTKVDYVTTGEVIGIAESECTVGYDTVHTYKKDGLLTNKLNESELIRTVSCYKEIKSRFFFVNKDGKERDILYHSSEDESDDLEIYGKRIISASVQNIEYHYFLSAVKGDSRWRDTESRANIKFYSEEVIPLTYLCPTWIKYIITTGNLGGWRLGGKHISYAQSLKYLNRILQYLKELQIEERKMLEDAGLSNWIKNNSEWDVCVVEWRMENGIRKMTPYQAKRFAKYIQE